MSYSTKILLLIFVFWTRAQAGWIEPGEEISLSKGEGLALFVVDTDGSLSNIRIDKIGTVFSAPVLKKLGLGRSLRLLKLSEGDYQFDKAKLEFGWTTLYWEIKDLPNRRFRIEAGKLNYVGDLKVSGQLFWREMSIRNSGLRVYDELETQFPGLSKRYQWRYAGEFPDPFVEYYKQQLALHPESKTLLAPEIERPSIAQRDLANLLFRQESVSQEQLSPSGRYILEYRKEGTAFNAYLVDLKTSKNRLLSSTPQEITSAYWLSDSQTGGEQADDLLALTYEKSGTLRSSVMKIKDSGPLEAAEIPASGNIYIAHSDGSRRAIFARNGSGRAGLELFEITVSSLDQVRKLDDKALLKFPRVRGGVKNDFRWWFDADGVPRLAQCQDNGKIRYQYFASAKSDATTFTLEDHETNPNDIFWFAGFDQQGKLLAVSNRERAQVELIEFDPATQKEGAARFSQQGADVTGVLYGLNGEINGVRIKNAGRLVQVPFANRDQALQKIFKAAIPGETVYFGDARANGNRLVYAFGPKNPGSYYIYSAATKKLDLLALAAEHLEGRPMLDTERFEVLGRDNFKIEAFLTLPTKTRNQVKPALLVMPHGGPIGVFDTQRFDAEVQYFAQLGFAVVQINYRGSGGSGTAATNLGLGQYGRAIEEDVDAVVESLIQGGKVDSDRIVALGTSYGGYSALMLTLDKPERYKAAVSIAGVTDILAQFSGGDVTFKKSISEQLIKIIGDPRTEATALQKISPVYRYEEFVRPIFLIHDRGDERVTIDQSERLLRLLRLRGTPPATIFLQDNTHGVVVMASAVDVYPKIAAFLLRSLTTAANR
jgi:dipeptidyl aminopeptidase/acylaminoacyl peptidase